MVDRREHMTIDPWTPLDYKQVFGSPWGGVGTNAPWLTAQDRRRLSAYIVLSAYEGNAARWLMQSDDPDRDAERREYGDAALVIDAALSALMGDTQSLSIPDADEYDPDEEPPADPAEEATWRAERAGAAAAADMLDRLKDWWDRENVDLTLLDAERKAVTLGDSVIIVTWDAVKQRPRLTVVDPAFYFPVLPTGLVAEPYPTRVHFLWSTPGEEYADGKERLTRITYDLRPLRPIPADTFLGVPTGEPTLPVGARWEGAPFESRIVRDYPWSDEPSEFTCYLTEATWVAADIGRLDRPSVDALSLDRATFAVREERLPDGTTEVVQIRDFDLGIDFLPVVHVPNTVPGEHHFGQSVIAKSAQVLDDLHSADTDAQAAASTTGSPMVTMSNVQVTMTTDRRTQQKVPETQTVTPGKIYSLGVDGRMDVLDTSAQLRQMDDHVKGLRRRFTQNARIPDEAVGNLEGDATQLSGIALRIRYGPLESLVRGMRLVRKAKHPLLLKFVQRMFMLADDYDGPAETFPADIVYGSFIPEDVAGVIQSVVQARSTTPPVISLETAVRMLMGAGLPIEDALKEIERIEHGDYTGAGLLADATGDVDLAREYLGFEPKPVTPAPALVPPGGVPAGAPPGAVAAAATGLPAALGANLPAGGTP